MTKRSAPFTLLILLVASFLGVPQVQAQDLNTDPRAVLDSAPMIESSISKVYRARVLLEDYRNWPEAYELLRDVLKNDTTLSKVAIKKLDKAAYQIKTYLPGRWFARTFNGRHLLRPFLEASYLINEALMDSRVALLKSYFFPGNEALGSIEFPAYETYAFDLYALTPENIQAGRRARSDEAATPVNSAAVNSLAAAPIAAQPNTSPDKYLEDLDLTRHSSAANGFITEIIESGVAISEITEEVQDLIKRYQVPNRVQNRYQAMSMLLQAIVDPGTALFDPQLQSFLKGVRLKVALGQSPNLGEEEIAALKDLLGNKAVFQKDGETRIRLGYLIEQQRNSPFSKSGLELSLQDVKGTGRSILFAVSAISGEEQMMLRTLQAAATIARDTDRAVKIGSTIASNMPLLAKLQTLGSLSLDKLLAALPAAATAVNEMARVANATPIGAGLKTIAWALRGVVSLQSLGVKVTNTLSPKAMKLISRVKNSKYVKNGTATGVLTLVVVATQITVGVIEYRASEEEERKEEIYVDTLSRVGASVSYLLPVVGWAAAALDLGHAFLGVPVETADLFKGVHSLTGTATLWFIGTSEAELQMDVIESKLNIPRHAVFFTHWPERVEATVESAHAALTGLRAEVQNLAFAEMTFIYVALRSFASEANYKYGERLESHHRSFLDNKKNAIKSDIMIKEKLRSLLPVEVSAADTSDKTNDGAEGSSPRKRVA